LDAVRAIAATGSNGDLDDFRRLGAEVASP
jgi:hypothetical protein